MRKTLKLTPQMEKVWADWVVSRKTKVPASKRRGPRFVFTEEQKLIRRTAYLAGYYGRKREYFLKKLEELEKEFSQGEIK
jgi:predicted DNA binding protein